ncbi:VWA domain-containing protein [Dactylosporangium sp. NPDC048998]|uniref:vWA domain-containing protein n=1 Tax=Dactylosporangium sp. NPDC048998 TaxID=3363976 RepID=UPI003721076E
MSTSYHTADTSAYATKQKCLPTYLLIDVSSSMRPHQGALNETLKKLHRALADSPRVSEFAHMSIVAFSTQPWVVLEMVDMEYVPAMPEVMCDGWTNYGAAFDLVRQRINTDLPTLRAQGKAVMRPCVFLLTDGEPTDKDWETGFAALTDRGWGRRPHIITYGFGQASEMTLAKVSTKAAFIADGTSLPDEALARAINSLLNSLVASAATEELQIPVEAPGYRSIPVEYVD